MSGAADKGAGLSAVSAGRGRRPVLFCALMILVALGCAALGWWQVERRTWKHDLIARVEARIHAAPIPVPVPDAWPSLSRADSEYLKVRASGTFLNDSETLVQAVTEHGAGFWLMVPLRTRDGFLVLVNRGFIPVERKAATQRLAGQVEGETTVTGLLRMSEPGGGFLRANDPAADRWYSRDVPAIAAARSLRERTLVAPFFIDADATPNPGGIPVGGLTVVAFADNHLSYALTWFALAVMASAGAVWIWRRRD